MPLLSRADFRLIVPQLADVLAPDDRTFEAAERDASEIAVRLAGCGLPASAEDAPAALKRPVAHLIVHALMGMVSAPAEQITWARQVETRAREDLAALRGQFSHSHKEGQARIGHIDAAPSW